MFVADHVSNIMLYLEGCFDWQVKWDSHISFDLSLLIVSLPLFWVCGAVFLVNHSFLFFGLYILYCVRCCNFYNQASFFIISYFTN